MEGPYVTSTEGYTDLALKRALQEAVKGGYDKLVISPGQANADLYGLSRHVQSLSYHPDRYELSYVDAKTGMPRKYPEEVDQEDLPKLIGKDMAQRLLSTPRHPMDGNHILENLDTNVGGEGMRKYYDRDVPQRLQKLTGSMDPDAKVQMGAFPLTDQYQGHAIDITDKMRDAVQQGLPAFKQGGDVEKAAGGRTGYAVGGTPARYVNRFGYYSKGVEAARNLSQKKGSPQQMRSMLEKAGVKPDEFKNSGFDEEFTGRPSVTSDEIVQHFHKKMPEVRQTELLSSDHDDYDPNENEGSRFEDYTLAGGNNYREHLLKLPETNNNFQENRHWPGHKNVAAHIRMADRGTPVDPEMAQSTIDKMLADKQMMSLLSRDPGNWGSGAADYALKRGAITPEEALNLSQHRRWHNDVTRKARPERNLHVEEIQSDWGQGGRKHGFKEPDEEDAVEAHRAFVEDMKQKTIDKLMGRARAKPELYDNDEAQMRNVVDAVMKYINPGKMADELGISDQFKASLAKANRFEKQPVEGPYVTSTPGWTNLALKHVLKEAVNGGYNKVVFSPGQANVDMYPGLDEKQEAGIKSFYDQILPTQMNKLAKSLDPDHPGVQMGSHPLPNASGTVSDPGYMGHSLDITDDLRDAVKKGLPAFKQGGMAPINNPMVHKAMALARNLTRR